MSTDVRTFRPLANTQTVAATDTNSNLVLSGPGGSRAVRIYNAGTSTVFLSFGGTAAVATGMPMPSGGVETFSISIDITSLGIICDTAGTATVYVTVGEGL